MRKKIFFIKYSLVIVLVCFLSGQSLFSQTITKETKKATISTKGIDKKAVNNNSSLNAPYVGSIKPSGYVNKPSVNKTPIIGSICNPCAIPNNETDIPDNGTDVTNGGCVDFSPPYLYTPISMEATHCGRINGYLVGSDPWRDLDWYKLTLSVSTTVYFSAYTNFAEGSVLFFVDYSSCSVITYSASPGSINTLSATLPAGDYYAIISSPNFGPGIGGDYMIKISNADPGPNPATWCISGPNTTIPTLSEWGLIILGFVLICLGIYYIRKRSLSIS